MPMSCMKLSLKLLWNGEKRRMKRLYIYLCNKYLLSTNCVPGRETMVQKFVRKIPILKDLTITGRERGKYQERKCAISIQSKFL